ncbi:MAG: sigma 54-interacting transcriptional regulator [Desulfomonilaceae bacterium]|nr:sigma 54-interacting transcriptional regulator [Desulfomonilaceae bacterium]
MLRGIYRLSHFQGLTGSIARLLGACYPLNLTDLFMKYRILIVEDEGMVAKGVEKTLQSLGYAVVGLAATGEDAVRKAGETRPDLVLMDIMLAGDMDGIEAARQIHAGYDIPVIYLSAYADRSVLERAKLTEPYGYLVKPLTERDLQSTIEMALYKARLQKQLKEGERRFRELAELLPQTVYEVDRQGTFTFINHCGMDALGYTAEDVKAGLKVTDTVVTQERDRLIESMNRVLSGERVSGSEYTMRHRSGSTFTVVFHGLPIRRQDEILGMRGVAVDITELKRTQSELERARDELENRVRERTLQLESTVQELRKTEAKYRTLVEHIPAITYITEVDEANTVVYVSPQAETYLGTTIAGDAVASHFWSEHLHQDDRDKVLAGRSRSRGKGEPFIAEYRIIGGDDRVTWFRDEADIIRDEDGRPMYVLGIMLDITDRKRAEQRLRESEELFRAIFESASDCIFIKDASLRFTHVNPAMESLFNTPARSLIGKSDESLFGAEIAAHSREVDSRVIAGNPVDEEHTRPVHGVPTTFHVTKVPIRDHSGVVIGLCGIARDITERRSALAAVQVADRPYPSESMKATLSEALRAAETDSIILLTGESGSGKDYMAKYIHDHSRRAGGPFFSVNCAAVAPELAESELFGHEPGAFTGARGRKRGLLELAEGGTLLLNEVGELSLGLQAKLLTFLDTKSFTKLGGEKNVTIDARLIAATNRDLEREVNEGRFRTDLYYRLNVLAIQIPPLRERKDDLPVIVPQIISRLIAEMQLQYVPAIDARTMERLRNYSWPGNIRELRNVLERALILSKGRTLELDLAEFGGGEDTQPTPARETPPNETLNEVVAGVKRKLVIEALKRNAGNRSKAARDLGISRYSMIHYIKSLGIEDADVC